MEPRGKVMAHLEEEYRRLATGVNIFVARLSSMLWNMTWKIQPCYPVIDSRWLVLRKLPDWNDNSDIKSVSRFPPIRIGERCPSVRSLPFAVEDHDVNQATHPPRANPLRQYEKLELYQLGNSRSRISEERFSAEETALRDRIMSLENGKRSEALRETEDSEGIIPSYRQGNYRTTAISRRAAKHHFSIKLYALDPCAFTKLYRSATIATFVIRFFFARTRYFIKFIYIYTS